MDVEEKVQLNLNTSKSPAKSCVPFQCRGHVGEVKAVLEMNKMLAEIVPVDKRHSVGDAGAELADIDT